MLLQSVKLQVNLDNEEVHKMFIEALQMNEDNQLLTAEIFIHIVWKYGLVELVRI